MAYRLFRRRLAANVCAVFLACTSGHAVADLPPFETPDSDEMRAHFIDVGEGSAVLLEFSCGAALIDTGGERTVDFDSTKALHTYLEDFFGRRDDLNRTIDLLVLTHPHIDHTRGVSMVLNGYSVSNLVDNGLELGSGGRQQRFAHRRVRSSNGAIQSRAVNESEISAAEGLTDDIIDPIDCEGTDPAFSVVWGALEADQGWTTRVLNNLGNSSIVVRLAFGQASFLFAGDLEVDVQPEMVDWYLHRCREAELDPCSLDVDVYHVSQHGSQTGTSEQLLRAMSPEIAVISMGTSGRPGDWGARAFGHPRASVVEMLRDSEFGVSGSRDRPATVRVANRSNNKRSTGTGSQFTTLNIEQAVYGTGWEKTVVVTANADGSFDVATER